MLLKPKSRLNLTIVQNLLIKINKNLNYNELKNTSFNVHKIQNKFKVGEKVLYRNHHKEYVKWIPAIVQEIISQTTYLIAVNDYIRYVHENQLKVSKLNDEHHPMSALAPSNRDAGDTVDTNSTTTDVIPDTAQSTLTQDVLSKPDQSKNPDKNKVIKPSHKSSKRKLTKSVNSTLNKNKQSSGCSRRPNTPKPKPKRIIRKPDRYQGYP